MALPKDFRQPPGAICGLQGAPAGGLLRVEHLRRQQESQQEGRAAHSADSEAPGLGWQGPSQLLGWPPGLDGAWEPRTVSRTAGEKPGDQPPWPGLPVPIHGWPGDNFSLEAEHREKKIPALFKDPFLNSISGHAV